jgi:Reverse transcriptase (RNA-dependent DNA polymerase)
LLELDKEYCCRSCLPLLSTTLSTRSGAQIDTFIRHAGREKVKKQKTNRKNIANVGCYVHFICCAIFLYADDIVLLVPPVTGLQLLLTTWERYLSEIGMNINVSKSTCIRFGRRFSNVCEKLRLCNGEQLDWSMRCKYLGMSCQLNFLQSFV